jgi:excisionase family DNA binding protein
MTVDELADYLQLNRQTIYRKVRAGQIPAIRIGKVLRFKKEVIDSWLRQNSLRSSRQGHLRDFVEGKIV